MTTTPPEAPHDEGPRTTSDEVRDLGRLRRSVTDRKVAGVAGGLARHLDIDPVILRVAFVVLAFFGGAGLILYGAAWLLVPEEGEDHATLDLDERSRTVALVALMVIAALALVGDSWGGGFWFPWPLIVVALVVGLVWLAVGSRGRPVPAPEPQIDPVTGEPLPPAESWTGGPTTTYAAPPRPRDPRKRGPLLFWFTLALIAFALGVLGIVDLAGVSVADSAYAALAVAVTGVMLLVGSVMGRAGGLILVGLVACTALVGTTVSDRWDGSRLEEHPTSTAEVQDSYSIQRGELVVDLSDVSDVDALDGRTISVSGEAGRLEVILPEDVDADVEATMDGPGGYELFGAEGGGIDWTRSADHDSAAPDAPALTIDAHLAVGEIAVTTE